MLSIVVTVHNEGSEVSRTIRSIVRHTANPFEIILVDDGSTDGCCSISGVEQLRVIRRDRRVGVAYSRIRGAESARGDFLAFLDGHQRLSRGCLSQCVQFASRHEGIVWPDVRGFRKESPILHGAHFRLCRRQGLFSASWRASSPSKKHTRVTSLRCPGYVMSRNIYERVRWIDGLKNWGGSEAAVSIKAFFLDIPINHLCGPVARHLFKSTLDYAATWDDVWRNHALIARVCFDERTWNRYWLPNVFAHHLTAKALRDLESSKIHLQHENFQALKVRSDREFWTKLLKRDIPRVLL